MTINSDKTNRNPLRLLAFSRAGEDKNKRIIEYAEQLTTLLDGRLDHHLLKESEPATLPKRYFATYNLILLSELTTFINARSYQTAPGRNSKERQPQPALLAR